MSEVLAAGKWKNNGELFADVAKSGYITGPVVDLTYGKGLFWSHFRPTDLTTNDLSKNTWAVHNHDFRATPWGTGQFETVVLDPPYKLNGQPALGEMDDRYGVEERATRRERMALVVGGTAEAARLSSKWLLVKCQDQVNGGRVRWQTDVVSSVAWASEFEKVDWFILEGGRKQPNGRSQEHARRGFSTLLVFKRMPR